MPEKIQSWLADILPCIYNALMTSNDLLEKLHGHPFKPFRIRMVDSTAYKIGGPWMMMVGKSSALVVTETGKTSRGYDIALDWKNVSIDHMTEITDLPPLNRSSKRKA